MCLVCHPLFCVTRLYKDPITPLQSFPYKPVTVSGLLLEPATPRLLSEEFGRQGGGFFPYLVTQWRSSLIKFIWSSQLGADAPAGAAGPARARLSGSAPRLRERRGCVRPRPGERISAKGSGECVPINVVKQECKC